MMNSFFCCENFMKINSFLNNCFDALIRWQAKAALWIVLLGLLIAFFTAPRAVKLLSSIKTDLINLLPDDYPAVKFNNLIKKKFDRRSSLYLIIHSPDRDANFKAMQAANDFLLKELKDDIDYIETKKNGFEYFDENKLLLIDLKDLYEIKEKLADRISKKKLGALYIDFEDEEADSKNSESGFQSLVTKYKEEFTQGVRSPYKTNDTGTVYVLDIYPKNTDASLKFFKQFGEKVQGVSARFPFTQYHPDMTYGFAGAIVTRVDQYNALIDDLKQAGIVSGAAIFVLLYLYFGLFTARPKGARFVLSFLFQLAPVIAVFIPMVISTLASFWFCSWFFDGLNVVTSFLFAIIFGLGVDVGIHLITRYFQDRRRGIDLNEIHRTLVKKTGKSCAIGILTTVASFYILTINDFRGFSEFGWIAGHGLVIALLSYLIIFPSIILFFDRHSLFWIKSDETKAHDSKRKWVPFAKPILAVFVLLLALSAIDLRGLQFEWDFSKLQLKLDHREKQKALLLETSGRVNSPAAYLLSSEVEARKLRKILRERQAKDTETPTIQFFRSFYDMVPFDQDEKMAVLGQIRHMLEDDALNSAKDDEKKMIEEFKDSIGKTKKLSVDKVPQEIYELFWGNTGDRSASIAYAMPLAHLQLGNGNIAREFYHDVHRIDTLGKSFYALSDAMVFAEVLQTLFRDSQKAILFALLVIALMIAVDLRNLKRTVLVIGALLCGLLWMLGLMALFDLKLNFYNMIIIPAMIGMGVDNSVHVLHRFLEEKRENMIHTLKTSGGAALMASFTTMLGYAGLCVTRHPGLESIGWMALVGMGTCLVASLCLLPLCLQLFDSKN